MPAHPARAARASAKAVATPSTAIMPTVQAPRAETAALAPAPVAPSPSPKPVVAPAPPPIYAEPPHVPSPHVEQAPKRKPFGETVIASAARPAQHSEPPHAPSLPPAEYKPPAVVAAPVVEAKLPDPVEPPHSEPVHVTQAHQVAIQAGTPITVRLIETLSTEHAAAGEVFQATLADPLVCEGLIIAERGARVTGRVTDAKRAGRFGGVSSIELRLMDLTTADGQRIAVSSDPWLKRGDSMGRDSAAKIGGGAALGAVIGAIAGGGLGAAIGAGAGGTAGAGAQAITGGKPVTIPSETVIQFRLASPVKVTERQL